MVVIGFMETRLGGGGGGEGSIETVNFSKLGEFRVQYKLGSYERTSLTNMCQLVLQIMPFKVIFPPHMDTAIFLILSFVPIKNRIQV